MRKLSDRPSAHNPQRNARNHYEHFRSQSAERHPVELAVETRLRHAAKRKRIVRLQNAILRCLGGNRRPFLELAAVHNDIASDREAAFFNVGFDYGAGETRRSVLREMSKSRLWPKRIEHVAARLRDEVFQAGLAPHEVLFILAESLWVLAAQRMKTR